MRLVHILAAAGFLRRLGGWRVISGILFVQARPNQGSRYRERQYKDKEKQRSDP